MYHIPNFFSQIPEFVRHNIVQVCCISLVLQGNDEPFRYCGIRVHYE